MFPEVPTHQIIINNNYFPDVPKNIITDLYCLINQLSKYLNLYNSDIEFQTKKFKDKLFDKRVTLVCQKNNEELKELNKKIEKFNILLKNNKK